MLNNNYKRIIVTGGSGFIGSCLIRKLLSKTNCYIFNLDKLSYSSNEIANSLHLNNLNPKSLSRYKLIKVDLCCKDKVQKIIEEISPDLIFHLAAESHVDRSIDNPNSFISSNINGTFNLLEGVRNFYSKLQANKKKFFRFHHISTDEVFGSLGQEGEFNEGSQYSPRSPYSASKAASDHLVNAWHHTYQLPSIITNCSNNFGPWQFPEKLIPLTIYKAINKEQIPLYGNGENIRDWLFVEEHINALIIAATKGKIGGTYCIGGDNEMTNKELVEKICRILDVIKPTDISYEELITLVPDRPGHDFRYAINSNKIQSHLGWTPKSNFESQLRNTINWYINNMNWCTEIMQNSTYRASRLGLKNFT